MSLIQQAHASGISSAINATLAGTLIASFQSDPLGVTAAALSIIWFGLEIWESDTVKHWRQRHRRRQRRRARMPD